MATLNDEFFTKCREEFAANDKYEVAQNAVAKFGIDEACLRRSVVQGVSHHYSHRIPDPKPVTNQQNSGRCWLFAATNAMRVPLMAKYDLETFELSQQYLFFWDKVERSNFFLENVIKTREEGLDGRVVSFLLANPMDDGGQWDMMAALITKHGVVPKHFYPDAHGATKSSSFCRLLSYKLRAFAKQLRDLSKSGKSEAELRAVKMTEMMPTIYRICCIGLGTPPSSFDWEYTNRSNEYGVIRNLTPTSFYETVIKPIFNVEDKICLVHDPRPENPFGHAYTVQYLGNVVGGKCVTYINVPIDQLKNAAAKSICEGKEPVWFGSDPSHCFEGKLGILDPHLRAIEATFDTSASVMDKADRLHFGETIPAHAMLLTAVNCKEGDGGSFQTTKWRVENSWGSERHDKGFLYMTDDWFTEFVFEVVVDKKYLPADVLEVGKQEPRVLPPWDPMGTLA